MRGDGFSVLVDFGEAGTREIWTCSPEGLARVETFETGPDGGPPPPGTVAFHQRRVRGVTVPSDPAVGSTWRQVVTSFGRFTVNGITHTEKQVVTSSFRVVREEPVTTPAGTFQALVVETVTTTRKTAPTFGAGIDQRLENDYTQLQTVNGVVNQQGTHLNDVGATIGGPIVKNRLFFFGAIDPQWEQARFSAPLDFPLASLGDVARDRRVVNYAAKATWQIANASRLDVSLFGDPSHGPLGPQRSGTTGVNDPLLRQDQAGFSTIDKYGGHNQAVRYSGAIGSRWLIEGSYSRAANDVVEIPFADEWQTTDRTVTPNVIRRTGTRPPRPGRRRR